MPAPSVELGVPLMDDDHAHLEHLLATVGTVDDGDLARLLAEIEAETRAHFAREEELMRECQAPVLHCHILQHELFLSQFSIGHEAARTGELAALRRFLGFALPGLLAEHVNTVDRVTAEFLRTADAFRRVTTPRQREGPDVVPRIAG